MNTQNLDLLQTLTSKEKKIRIVWAATLVLQFFISCFYIVALLLTSTVPKIVFPLLVVITITAFVSYLFYRCVYKKHGVIWITIYLITLPFSFYKLVFFDLRHSTNTLITLSLWLCAIIGCILYVLSIYIRKINKKIISNALDTDEYKSAVSAIREAHNLEDLEFKFYTSTQGKPRFFSKQLKKEYKTKKASFNS